ncbi:MAG TPA: asparagine synthase-related protein [Caulobacteraceae bacterium]|nr:asparagine synthase-related protein [Caulobacteraceae bacterium]
MLAALAPFGPDGADQRTVGPIVLGRRLKRLLPEDRYDRQPIESGARLLVADVRLTERDALAADLGLDPAWASRASDAALVSAAFDRWGAAAPARLYGDFALAWWDGDDRRLILARSPLAHRPLHYHVGAGFFAFASMPKGLHALPDVPLRLDLERFAHRVAQAPPGGEGTFFEGVRRVRPGRMVSVLDGRCEIDTFWRPERRLLRLKRSEDYEAGLRDALDRAVAASLRGVGDVASQMSGGLDSTSVTASAARLQAKNGGRVVAYTAAPPVGFNRPAPRGRFADESGHAAAVAALYPNIEHVVIRGASRGPLDDWDRRVWLFERPSLDPLNMGWGHEIFDDAKARRLPVMLVGDAGNATLSYEGRELFAELLRDGRWLAWWREALACVGQGGGSWAHVLKHTLSPLLPLPLLRRIPRTDAHRLAQVGRRVAAPAGDARRFDAVRDNLIEQRDPWASRVAWIQRMDAANEHKGALAGWGIDVRDPTADRRLVEFCLSIPNDQNFRDGVGRSLARRAMAGRLPPVVVGELRAGLQSAHGYARLGAERARLLAELDRLAACAPLAERADVAKLRAAVERWPMSGEPEAAQLAAAVMRTLAAAHFARRVMGLND